MTKKHEIQIFSEKRVRTVWDSDAEAWYFSVVDVVDVLTDSTDSRKYWNKLKQRLKTEGNETVTNCHQLKLQAADGKGTPNLHKGGVKLSPPFQSKPLEIYRLI